MESRENIAKAIVQVMQEVKGIDKSLSVGFGNSSYKGVSDKDVKSVIGKAMAKTGLSIIPIEINSNVETKTWEVQQENFKTHKMETKQKKEVFTEVHTKYLLLHTSGESIEISGYGHGIDNQDKGAGKATTYALKYALLYTFLVPTGSIDDTDTVHSNEYDDKGNVVGQKEVLTDDIKALLESVRACKTSDDINNVWKKNQAYKKNKQFIDVIKEVRTEKGI